ncbi:2,4-dienoyl-CoA reductase [Actinosynnema mirum]|uniref:oxidoreductase n=1 Tax=Actinosynnema mirum TaxID=40567 RepID=UPI00019AB313|nr:2,4-dienoyl-CoA reductase [Actinosynnema mirum]
MGGTGRPREVVAALGDPLRLASGSVLPNRVAKAALEEFLAVDGQLPGDELIALHRRWARGGAGLLITGHVMVDGRAVADPRDVVLEAGTDLEPFRRWASAARSGGGQVWMQINHPGRVVFADQGGLAWSASAKRVEMGAFTWLYATPVAMTGEQIAEVVARFADTAAQAERAGFDGVEVHAAHGYLIGQFLSPLVNRRADGYGGDLAARARLLLEVVAAVRGAVSPGFAVGVKLNTADFQRGGFQPQDAAEVIGMLSGAGVDLVELSGGSLESLAIMGHAADESTLAREAYFLDAAASILADAPLPVMITGGVRRLPVARRVLESGASVVGVGTALAVDPDLPHAWIAGEHAEATPVRVNWPDKKLSSAAVQALVHARMEDLAADRDRSTGPLRALLTERLRRRPALRRYRKWGKA